VINLPGTYCDRNGVRNTNNLTWAEVLDRLQMLPSFQPACWGVFDGRGAIRDREVLLLRLEELSAVLELRVSTWTKSNKYMIIQNYHSMLCFIERNTKCTVPVMTE
jgi:hypothetical protein